MARRPFRTGRAPCAAHVARAPLVLPGWRLQAAVCPLALPQAKPTAAVLAAECGLALEVLGRER